MLGRGFLMAVLLIGSTGSGKSTLGNFLLDPDNQHPDDHFRVGTNYRPTTTKAELKTRQVEYDIPLCDDTLEDSIELAQRERASCDTSLADDDSDVNLMAKPGSIDQSDIEGDVSSEEHTTTTGKYRMYHLPMKLVHHFSARLHEHTATKQCQLTVIDTPGLNDCAVRDLENMIDLVETLQRQQTIQACIFVVKFDSQIDQQYRDTITYYSSLQPSLFGHNSIIVMTNYCTDKKSVRKRRKQGIEDNEVISNVKKEIMKSSGMCYEPIVFALDCLPDDEDEQELAMAKSSRDSLLSCILSQRSVSTKDIMVAKTRCLKDDDENTIRHCEADIDSCCRELQEANVNTAVTLKEVHDREQKILSIDREIATLREDLQQKDSDEFITAATWSVDSSWKWFQWQSTQFDVTSEWEIAEVSRWDNGRCSWKEMHEEPKRAYGVIQGNFMRGLYARVTLETRKRVKFADDIITLNRQIRGKTEAREAIVQELRQKEDGQKEARTLVKVLKSSVDKNRNQVRKYYGNLMTLEQAKKRLEDLKKK